MDNPFLVIGDIGELPIINKLSIALYLTFVIGSFTSVLSFLVLLIGFLKHIQMLIA